MFVMIPDAFGKNFIFCPQTLLTVHSTERHTCIVTSYGKHYTSLTVEEVNEVLERWYRRIRGEEGEEWKYV